MSLAMKGALIGFAIGFIGFVMLRVVANRIEKASATSNPVQAAAVIRIAALADWLLFTLLGFFLGPMFLASN